MFVCFIYFECSSCALDIMALGNLTGEPSWWWGIRPWLGACWTFCNGTAQGLWGWQHLNFEPTRNRRKTCFVHVDTVHICSYVWYVLCVFMSPWFKVGLIGRFDYKPVQVISALEFWHFHGTKPKSVKHVVTGMIFSFVVSGVVRVSHFSKTAGICWNLPLVMVASLGRAEWRVYGVLFFTACLQPKVRALQLSSSTIFNYSRIYGMFDHNFLAMPFTAICSCEMYASSQET